jgi:hypothetical protein
MRKPRGLKAAGARLWETVMDEYDLDAEPHKLEILQHACRVADVIAKLERAAENEPLIVLGSARQKTIHPLIAEVRFQRGLQAQLLARLNFEGAVPDA